MSATPVLKVSDLPDVGAVQVRVNGHPISVVRGFFADVIEQIGLPDLQARLLEAVEVELSRVLPATEVTGA
jgi:hypothetical protein